MTSPGCTGTIVPPSTIRTIPYGEPDECNANQWRYGIGLGRDRGRCRLRYRVSRFAGHRHVYGAGGLSDRIRPRCRVVSERTHRPGRRRGGLPGRAPGARVHEERGNERGAGYPDGPEHDRRSRRAGNPHGRRSGSVGVTERTGRPVFSLPLRKSPCSSPRRRRRDGE